MKILLLSWNYPPAIGGIEAVVKYLFAGLKKKSPDVELVTSYASPEAIARLNAGDESEPGVHRCPKPGLKSYVIYAWTQGRRCCRAFGPEVILCGSIPTAPAAYLLSRSFKVPFGVLMHGSDIMKTGWVYQRVVRFLIKRADFLTSNSENTKRLLVEAGVPADRITVVYPGVESSEFAEVPTVGAEELLPELKGRKVMVSVGRLIRRKGILEFVRDGMPKVRDELPEILYLIVGDDATQSLSHHERLRDKILSAVHANELEGHVKLLGKISDADLKRLMFECDLFLLPGLDLPGDVEGFGIVFCEAALGGMPSVATRAGGMVEAVVDGATGLLATPGDSEDVAEKILTLMQDDALRAQYGEAAKRRAKEEFDWSVIVDQYWDVMAKSIATQNS